ncbi:MAG TPA: site-2 protease family protein [Pyrinomonadaceae bacterium]|nr:site-2 protease family protein [Pyrinomonadaceae bacterium]
MPQTDLLGQLIIYIVVLLLAISAHEAAHAWMSYKFGDDTAYLLGRVTLNPVAHTDPIGTLLIPVINFIGAGAGVFVPLIGWGKPTPVNPLRWRKKDLANVMVSIAGILANLIIALIAFFALKIVLRSGIAEEGGSLEAVGEPVKLLLWMGLSLNLSLAIFNLLPVPPLDGSKALYTILPEGARASLDSFEQVPMLSSIVLIGLIYFGVVSAIMRPVQLFVLSLL